MSYEGIGGGIRYFYNRTYGFEVGAQHPIYYDYTSSTGVKYSASSPNTWNVSFIWVPAMNMNITLSYSPSSPTELIAGDSPGRSYTYTLLLDYGL